MVWNDTFSHSGNTIWKHDHWCLGQDNQGRKKWNGLYCHQPFVPFSLDWVRASHLIINGSLENASWICLLRRISWSFLEQEALRCQCLLTGEILSIQIFTKISPILCLEGAVVEPIQVVPGCSQSCEHKCWNPVPLIVYLKEESAFLNLGKRPLLNGSWISPYMSLTWVAKGPKFEA